jgi:poly(glycerol-phosphate) alpha-glucosyltransferase
MRIAFLSASLSRKSGGLFDANRRVAQELLKLGNCVQAFGITDDQSVTDRADWLPVGANVVKNYGPKQLGYAPKLATMISDFSPDVLHSHGLWLGTSAIANTWGRKTGRPVILHPHGMLDPWAVNNSAWKKRIAGWLFESSNLRRATCIRALCDSEAESIRRFGLKNPIAIIPNGIDLPVVVGKENVRIEEACPHAKDSTLSDDCRQQKHDGASRSKKLLYLGRIHPKKGLVNLLRAWSEIERSGGLTTEKGTTIRVPWTLWIAGWDEVGHENDLKQLATELGIHWCDVRDGNSKSESASVLFLGPQFKNDKVRCYENCDAFVLPSFSEGLPMVVLEAWAYGKPALMTPHCNLPEGFAQESAIRIEATVESIGDGLSMLMKHTDDDRIAMGNRGRELVCQKFTWPEVAKQVHDLSLWAIHGGAPPDCLRLD